MTIVKRNIRAKNIREKPKTEKGLPKPEKSGLNFRKRYGILTRVEVDDV